MRVCTVSTVECRSRNDVAEGIGGMLESLSLEHGAC